MNPGILRYFAKKAAWMQRVLVVDDNEVNQKILQFHLQFKGLPCDIAASGQAALEAVKKQEYVLIFMDLRMPDLDGFETTRAIREMGCSTPIIALTASGVVDDEMQCMNAGMNGYMTKPFRKADFDDVVGRWLIQSQKQEAK